MKSIIAGIFLMSFTQNSFAEGTSIANASFGANFVRRGDVAQCIKQVEENKKASALIRDIRIVDKTVGTYEITLMLGNGDIMRGNVDIALTPKTVQGAFGEPLIILECEVKK